MTKKTTALIYSTLLWPGAGHVYLGRKKMGYVFIVLTLGILGVLFILFESELIRQMRLMPDPQMILLNANHLALTAWQLQKTKLIMGCLGLFGIWGYAALDILLKK